MQAISQASSAQARTVQNIAKSVESLARATQQAAASAEQSASAAEELSGQAIALDETVNQFKIEGTARGKSALSSQRRAGPPPLPRLAATGTR